MNSSVNHSVNRLPPSLGLSMGVALLLGVAFVQLLAATLAVEIVLMQQLAAQSWIRSSIELRALVSNLPSLSLPALFLSYALSFVALKLAQTQRVLHATAFVLPMLVSSAWWSYQINRGGLSAALTGMFASSEQVLGTLLVLLAVLLAYQHSARHGAA